MGQPDFTCFFVSVNNGFGFSIPETGYMRNEYPNMPLVSVYKMIAMLKKARKQSAPLPAPVFPKAAKYTIRYQRGDGRVNNYTVSNPISETPEIVTCYAFERGIRSFKRNRVLSITKA
jgi:hypothetical protein